MLMQAAAKGGHLEVVERLLVANADVNAIAIGYDGRIALQAAAEGGHLEVVKRLLAANADVNAAAGSVMAVTRETLHKLREDEQSLQRSSEYSAYKPI
jgi:ankyrin repeat protein